MNVARAHLPERALRTLILVVTGLVLLGACGSDERVFDADRFVGQPLGEVYRALDADPANPLPANFGYVLYELTSVVGAPSLQPGQELGRPAADWVVLVSCATTEPASDRRAASQTLVLGIAPKDAAATPILERARAHGFDDRVSECSDRVPTIALPATD